MNARWRMRFVACVLLGAVSAPAQALLETCTAAALPVAFGGYNPLSVSPSDTSGQVTVTCTAVLSIAANYTISLSPGLSGSYVARQLAFGSARLNYNLYTDSARTQVWGNGTGGTATVSDSYALALLLVVRNYTIYARMPAAQNVPAGVYTDTITVTINY